MQVFVIETHLLGGEQDIGVFECEDTAKLFIQQSDNLHGEPEVLPLDVIGEIEEEGLVYTASSYDAEQDLYFFESVYGRRSDAEAAAGDNGLVLYRTIRRKCEFEFKS